VATLGPKVRIVHQQSAHTFEQFEREAKKKGMALRYIALPEKFDLEYTGADGAKHRPVMLHRAILGSVERFMGTLLEHYAGALPLWLSPVQTSVIPIADAHQSYAREIVKVLQESGLRVELQEANETLGLRIRKAQNEKIPYMIVVGDKEMETKKVAVRSRSRGDLGQVPLSEFLAKAKEEINARTFQ
jgi:threonyl-tRNA synthetase